MMNRLFLTSVVVTACSIPAIAQKGTTKRTDKKPNVLFVLSDDQSFPYASVYGCKSVQTPAFDRVAKSGILFNNAYVTSPGSSPSRASILTGRYPWQIEDAGTHSSIFPRRYRTFPEALEQAGYLIGFTGKGWAPGDFASEKWPYNPAGPEYNRLTLTPPYTGIFSNDYAGNFEFFLKERKEGQPFYFWFGCKEPHRPYEVDSWIKDGKDLQSALVPDYLPDIAVTKGDILDYVVEIEWYDRQLGKMLDLLEKVGELNNTLIIVSADNGMPFPRSKANCYDQGVHVPLAISWATVSTQAGLLTIWSP